LGAIASAIAPLPTALLRLVVGGWAVIVIGVAGLAVDVAQPWVTYLDEGPIRSDGLGYHVWTRLLLDGSLDACRYPELGPSLLTLPAPSTDPDGVRCIDKYPPGLAVLRFPVMAPLVEQPRGDPLVTNDEHRAAYACALAALVTTAAVVVRTARRLRIPSSWANVAVLAFTFGTGLFVFGTYNAGFTHVFSAMFVALLLYGLIRCLDGTRSWTVLLLMGAAGFFLVSIRNTGVLLVAGLVGTFVLALRHRRGLHGRLLARQCLTGTWPALIGAFAAGVVQLGVNRAATGGWSLSSYGSETFLLDRPMQRSVLFSFERGLFSYTPIFAVVLALGVAVRSTRWATAVLAALIGAHVVLFGFWPSWELGGGAGFGHRGFIDLLPMAMLVLAAALARTTPRRRAVAAGAVLLCVVFALNLSLQMWNYEYPEFGVGADAYWDHTFGPSALWRQALARLAPF